jgi:hypothetical protein
MFIRNQVMNLVRFPLDCWGRVQPGLGGQDHAARLLRILSITATKDLVARCFDLSALNDAAPPKA